MKEEYQFKVGDRVQFKTWKEMEEEFGFVGDELEPDYINCKCFFTKDMKHLCGTFATIVDYIDKTVALKDFTCGGDTNWSYSLDMLKPAKPVEVTKEFVYSCTEKQFKKCIYCKHFDDSDLPNMFCNLSCEGINDGDFRYCPKNPESVIRLVEHLDYTIEQLQKENSRLKVLLEMKEEK